MEKKCKYDMLFIISVKADAGNVINIIKEYKNKNGGIVQDEKDMGKRKLPYEKKKETEGVYYEMRFELDPSSIKAITAAFNLNADILNFMITKEE